MSRMNSGSDGPPCAFLPRVGLRPELIGVGYILIATGNGNCLWCPRAFAATVRFSCAATVTLDSFVSLACGVGQCRTAIESGVPPCAYFVLRAPDSDAVGVGHVALAVRAIQILRHLGGSSVQSFSSRGSTPRATSSACSIEQSAQCLPPLLSPSNAPREVRAVHTRGVGQLPLPRDDEDALAALGTAQVADADREPDRIVPARGKVAEDLVEAAVDEHRDVLEDGVARAELAEDAGELEPKAASSTAQASAFAGAADVLARARAADNIDGREVSAADGADVPEARDARPMALKDRAIEWLNFDLPNGVSDARGLEPDLEAAHAAEKRPDGEPQRHLRTSANACAHHAAKPAGVSCRGAAASSLGAISPTSIRRSSTTSRS